MKMKNKFKALPMLSLIALALIFTPIFSYAGGNAHSKPAQGHHVKIIKHNAKYFGGHQQRRHHVARNQRRHQQTEQHHPVDYRSEYHAPVHHQRVHHRPVHHRHYIPKIRLLFGFNHGSANVTLHD